MIDLTPEEFRRLGHRTVDLLADGLRTVRDAAVRRPVPDSLKQQWLGDPPPASAVAPEALLARIEQSVLAHPMGNGSPRFFAWVNSPPAPLGILADLLAAGLDPSVAGGDHAATYVEHAVLNWLKAIVGAPPSAGAVLTSGGSVATLVGLAVMRHVKTRGADRKAGLQGRSRPMVAYTSSQGHSCIQKAVEILGLGSDHLRRVAVDAEFRMDLNDLRAHIAADRAAGFEPVAVVASAGTVNTGAIDPLDAIADLCAVENLWFHVDGAYGGVATLDPATRPLLAGLARADSLGVDPHKWLYMPVECGCAIVRDAQAMRDTFSLVPPYLRDDAAMPWFSEFTVQQTRGFKALKLWMVLQQVGLEGYGRLIAQDIARARALRARLLAHPDFELVAEGPLSITCFRYNAAWTGDVDALNRRIAERVQQDGRAFITTTELDGRSVLRACIVNFRTTDADLDELIAAIVSAAESLRSALGRRTSLPGRPDL